jgi:uncharacterized membrane protein YqjE
MAIEQPETARAGAPSDGVLATLRRIAAQALELLQLRVELLSTELEAEKLRLLSAVLRGLAAVLLAIVGVAMLSIGLVGALPERLRWLGALGLGALYIGAALWFWQSARTRLSRPGGAFAATAAELARDREALGS